MGGNTCLNIGNTLLLFKILILFKLKFQIDSLFMFYLHVSRNIRMD